MAENDQKTKQELEQEVRKKMVYDDKSSYESDKSKMLEKLSKIYSDNCSNKKSRKSSIFKCYKFLGKRVFTIERLRYTNF